jgi:hypothetical protein
LKPGDVRRLYEIRQKIKELEAEEETLKNNIKTEMIKADTEESVVDNYLLSLKTQHRIEIDDEIVPYLKEHGYGFLIVEKCDQAKFKTMLNSGLFYENYDDIKDYIRRKDLHFLYLKPRWK